MATNNPEIFSFRKLGHSFYGAVAVVTVIGACMLQYHASPYSGAAPALSGFNMKNTSPAYTRQP